MTYHQFVSAHLAKTTDLFRGLKCDASDRRKVKHYLNRLFKMSAKARAMPDCPPEVLAGSRQTRTGRCIRFSQRAFHRIEAA